MQYFVNNKLQNYKKKNKLQKKFSPRLTSFKRNYITARRSVKKEIKRSREGNHSTENNDDQGEAEEVEEHNQNMADEDYPNLFKICLIRD